MLPAVPVSLPSSPYPVAVAALVVGVSVTRAFGTEADSPLSSARGIAAHLVPAVATVGVAIAVWTTPVEAWLWSVLAAVGAMVALAPLIGPTRVSSRLPTPSEAAALSSAAERDAVDVRIVPARDRIDGYALDPLAGTIGVSEAAVAVLSPDELAALVAHERAHLDGRHALARAVASLCWMACGGLAVVATFPGSTATALVLIGVLLGERVVAMLVVRYTEYAADARAAESTSPAALGSLLRTLAAADSGGRSNLRRFAAAHPCYERRLARLEPD